MTGLLGFSLSTVSAALLGLSIIDGNECTKIVVVEKTTPFPPVSRSSLESSSLYTSEHPDMQFLS